MISETNSIMYSSEWDATNMMDTYGYDQSNDFVLESWLTEQDPSSNGSILEDDDEDMMMVDPSFDDPEEIPPTPPAGRLLLEEALADTLAEAAHQGDDDDESFFANDSQSEPSSPISVTSFLPLEQRYQATLEKLTESMKRSQETRKSLRMSSSETAEYSRWESISGTLSSIEKSTQQLREHLNNKKSSQVL